MTTVQGLAGSHAGQVRAVFSVRARGHAVPLALLQAHLRGAAKLAKRRAGDRRRCGEGERVRAAFADYLVSDHAPAFSGHRQAYQPGASSLCVTGGRSPLVAVYRDAAGGPLDAPECIAAGACDSDGFLWGIEPGMVAFRDLLLDEFVVQFAERRGHWLDFVKDQDIGMSGRFGAYPASGLCVGFDNDSLDAPAFIASGCMRWSDVGSSYGYVAQGITMISARVQL